MSREMFTSAMKYDECISLPTITTLGFTINSYPDYSAHINNIISMFASSITLINSTYSILHFYIFSVFGLQTMLIKQSAVHIYLKLMFHIK